MKKLIISITLLMTGAAFSETAKPLSSVYFDTDISVVKNEEAAKLKSIAEEIISKNMVVALIGNADKRGSSVYNFKLADKRANAVKSVLMSLGVSEKQLVVSVSQGKEKPLAPADNLPAHLQSNRRVDVVVIEPLTVTVTKTKTVIVSKPYKVEVEKRLVRRHRFSILGGYTPSGVNKAKVIAPNTYQIKEDFDLELGGSYSFLTPLFNDRLSITGMGFTNKSGFIGLGLDF